MARSSTNTSQTEFYRLLVEMFYEGKWNETLMYGPYPNVGSARSTISGAEKWHKAAYEKGIRRSRVQKQAAVDVRVPGLDTDIRVPTIDWIDVA